MALAAPRTRLRPLVPIRAAARIPGREKHLPRQMILRPREIRHRARAVTGGRGEEQHAGHAGTGRAAAVLREDDARRASCRALGLARRLRRRRRGPRPAPPSTAAVPLTGPRPYRRWKRSSYRPDGSPDGTPMNRATRRTGEPIEHENRRSRADATDTSEFSLDTLPSSCVRNQKLAMNC